MSLGTWIGRLVRRLLAFLRRRPGEDPHGEIADARREFEKRMAEVRASFAKVGATVGRLKARVETNRARRDDVHNRLSAYRRVGQEVLAAELQREQQLLDEELLSDERELETAERLHQSLLDHAQVLHRGFRQKLRRVQRLVEEVEAREAEADAATRLINEPFDLTPSHDTLSELESRLEDRHAQAAGRLEVAEGSIALESDVRDEPEDAAAPPRAARGRPRIREP